MKEGDIQLLMAYLYGEMEEGEKATFEARIAEEAALRAELTSLQAAQGMLHESPQAVPAQPPLVMQLAAPQPKRSLWSMRVLQLAAACALLLVAARFSGLQVQTSGEQLIVSFGEQGSVTEASDPWEQQLYSDQIDLQANLCAIQEMLQLMKQEQAQSPTIDPQAINQLKNTLLAETRRQAQSFFAAAEQRQADQMIDIFNQFSLHLDDQRVQDLENIEYALEELMQQAAFQQAETDLIRTEMLDRLGDGR